LLTKYFHKNYLVGKYKICRKYTDRTCFTAQSTYVVSQANDFYSVAHSVASILIQAGRNLRTVKNKEGRRSTGMHFSYTFAQVPQACYSCINNKIQHIRAFHIWGLGTTYTMFIFLSS